jgi:hypothetical protein
MVKAGRDSHCQATKKTTIGDGAQILLAPLFDGSDVNDQSFRLVSSDVLPPFYGSASITTDGHTLQWPLTIQTARMFKHRVSRCARDS